MTKKHTRLLTHIGFSCVMCVAFASSLLLLLASCQQPINEHEDKPLPTSQPSLPSESGEPDTSDAHDEPETPNEPETPDEPDAPETPETPDEPDTSDAHGEPETPEPGVLEELLAYLKSLEENSAANPYLVELAGLDLSDEDTLKSLYKALSRFVDLDLSECFGERIPNITLAKAPNKANIVSITLPESVKTIAAAAFSGLEKLQSVDMPGVIAIEGKENSKDTSDGAFANCIALTSVSLPEVKTLGKYAFYGCSALPSISLPEVETIGASAFRECSSLTPMSLLQVTLIGNTAFYTGKGGPFTSITLGSEPPELEEKTVFHASIKIYVPASALDAYKSTTKENWTTTLKARVTAIQE